ncbi:MAG: hypothetical protein MZW92_09025 [Comamonadaceae bacterium]|nr:hypothetical protein [Comamonadaceae bacterium]
MALWAALIMVAHAAGHGHGAARPGRRRALAGATPAGTPTATWSTPRRCRTPPPRSA